MNKPRRTQAQRREETHALVLESACRLFGEKGYAGTSLDDVATDCGLTTRPIYHYFGNKQALFAAVNETMEARIVESQVEGDSTGKSAIVEAWGRFLDLCNDAAFRQIVLIDAPTVLGRERWGSSEVAAHTRRQLVVESTSANTSRYRAELLGAMVMGAFSEAALWIAKADDVDLARSEAERLVEELFDGLGE